MEQCECALGGASSCTASSTTAISASTWFPSTGAFVTTTSWRTSGPTVSSCSAWPGYRTARDEQRAYIAANAGAGTSKQPAYMADGADTEPHVESYARVEPAPAGFSITYFGPKLDEQPGDSPASTGCQRATTDCRERKCNARPDARREHLSRSNSLETTSHDGNDILDDFQYRPDRAHTRSRDQYQHAHEHSHARHKARTVYSL